MPITETDIKFYQSDSTSSADNEGAEFDGLGGHKSTTEVVNDTVANVFDNITADESESGDKEYRCIFVVNKHATLTFEATRVYLETNSPMCALTTQLEASGGETVVYVDDNSLFPTKGTFFVGSEEINYTAKNVGNTQFTGCTRAYNGTALAQHIVTSKCEYNRITIAVEAPTGSSTGHVQTISTESTVPSTIAFSAPRTFATGLVMGDLAPDEKYGIWICRQVGKDSQALNDIYHYIRVQGSTGV